MSAALKEVAEVFNGHVVELLREGYRLVVHLDGFGLPFCVILFLSLLTSLLNT